MDTPLEVTVVGAGIAGLGSALAMARAGHKVTVVERDDTPMPPDAEAAFKWDRRGAASTETKVSDTPKTRSKPKRKRPTRAELLAVGS